MLQSSIYAVAIGSAIGYGSRGRSIAGRTCPSRLTLDMGTTP